MDKSIVLSERERFSALSSEDAKAILKHAEGQATAMRSCWYCNGAHEHLKRLDHPFLCFGCGGWYLHGYPAPIVTLRAEDKPITDDVMQQAIEYTSDD